jgi:choline dehydrogenase-like flavoprotein
MHGTLRDRWNRPAPVEFSVNVDSDHAGHFARNGRARVVGIVRAPPWTEDAVLEGVICVRPVLGRSITYDLAFSDDAGRTYRLEGRKSLSWRRPLSSLTDMGVALFSEGECLARGRMVFEFSEALRFLHSWSLQPARARFDLGRRVLDDGATSEDPLATPFDGARQVAIFDALARACIAPTDRIPAADLRTRKAAMALISDMPEGMRKGYAAGLGLLDGAARLEHGVGLDRLETTRARAWVETMASASGGPRQRLLQGLALPIKVGHFSREDSLERSGAPRFPVVTQTREPEVPSRLAPRILSPETIEAVEEVEAEVVVIGTGAGGAAMAAELAERGMAVAVVESGAYASRADFQGPPLERTRKLWRGRGMQFSVGNCVASIPTGRVVGGTTTINSGTCYRTPDEVLEEWRALGFPSDFGPEAFSPWLDRVEHELGVGTGDPAHLGRIASTVARGADAMGFEHGPLPRNAPGCDGQGTCIYGCPTGAKRSANVSWVPRALQAGACLYTGMRVQTLLRRGRRFAGVVARGQDRWGVTKTLKIRAAAVVVACGTLASPGLLRSSGVDLPALGSHLSIHPGLGMFIMQDEPGRPWNAVPQGYGAWGHGMPGVRLEGFYLPPQMAAAAHSALGGELSRWMEQPDRVDQFGFMVRDPNDGRVVRGPGGTIIRKDIGPPTVDRLRGGAAMLSELLLRGGAKEVWTGIAGVPSIRSVSQARMLASRDLRARDFTVLGAHPLSTCRMGASARDSVVGFDHRVHGTENLYVVDGASVPSSLGVNPQMTIMAMALRAGELLAASLS